MPFFRINSEVWVNVGNGSGSTNTVIRRWSTILRNEGSAITYADSAANGGSFTINEDGIYAITRCDMNNTTSVAAGISVNSNQLTSGINGITGSHVLSTANTAGANDRANVAWSGRLSAGDVVRGHDGLTPANHTGNEIAFRIIKTGH